MLNPDLPVVEQLHRQFIDAKPFKHISIDNFLVPEMAQQLLDQFPKFDPVRAKNEMGQIGGKATQENVRSLGEGYRALDDHFSSAEFLAYLSKLTGIQNLLFDPEYFGGGTHDNLHGQELDVHVDFNYHRSTKLHRRLNLIIYLNHEWDPSWGGNIEIHSDPRNPERDTITSFTPLFNRCVIFETNEVSWHGFSEINLPENRRQLSRKSMTLYFYTKTRPEHEIVPVHNTFYIQRPLPESIKAGEVLTAEDFRKTRALLQKRDIWLQFYQNLELRLNGEITNLKHYLSEIEGTLGPETLGYLSQIGKAAGYYPDHWITPSFQACYKTHRDLKGLSIDLQLAPGLPDKNRIEFRIDDVVIAEPTFGSGERAAVKIPFALAANEKFTLTINCENYFCPKQMGLNSDERHLACLIEAVISQH